MHPLASVVMAVWNGESYIGEAIDSVLAQSFRDFEFIIVDDGSTDNTADVVARSIYGDNRVRFYRRAHEGMVPAFNYANHNSASNYLVHLDADDLASPERLAVPLERQAVPYRCCLG